MRLKFLFFGIFALLQLCTVGCSKSDGGDEKDPSFKLSSEQINCSINKQTVRAPFAGKTYLISVKTSPQIQWTASVKAGTLASVSPEGTQSGDGNITITVAPNPDKEKGRIGSIVVKNTLNSAEFEINFEQKEKELYFPSSTVGGQKPADFLVPTSDYNIYYMVQSDDVALLWQRSLGLDPTVANRNFDPNFVIGKAQAVYDFIIDDLGFADRDKSFTNMYKQLIFVTDDDEGTAYGGGNGNVGMIWLRPGHLRNERLGILHHEMSHSFQSMASFDSPHKVTLNGPINEATSQYTLLRAFPNWADLEPGHYTNFMNQTHYAYLHEDNGYRHPYVLEFWNYKHNDRKFVARLWKEVIPADDRDVVAAYKRIAGRTQEQFNDDMYEASSRFITWDIPLIRDTYAHRANNHVSKIINVSGKTYRIAPERCPQNYGYNGIRLNVPAAGTKVTLNFTGSVGSPGYNVTNADKQGWRYGFVAYKSNKERVYGPMGKTPNGTLEFTVPEGTTYLWLVVMGAPTVHWKHVVDKNNANDNQWPYQFTLLGTDPHPSVL